MILRSWSARATADGARAYVDYFRRVLVPQLDALAGHRGATVATRALGDGVEILVLTVWDSLAAIEAFAGAEVERAVVEPEARALLRDFDERVVHRELAVDTTSLQGR
jgi:heme-degrading monooxygenase HmoA